MLVKICTGCKIPKDISNFWKNKMGRNGLQPKCKECLLTQQRNRRKLGDDTTYRYRYGKTSRELNQLRLSQNNQCSICKKEFTDTFHTVVDHCHKTKTFRGFLCRKCNVGLGMFEDSVENLKEAIKYLSTPM